MILCVEGHVFLFALHSPQCSLLFIEIDISLLTARETDDFDLDVNMVAVANCDVGPITVSAAVDNKVEDQGVEVFLLSIVEDAAYMYIVGKPSIATVYIKGTLFSIVILLAIIAVCFLCYFIARLMFVFINCMFTIIPY